MERQEKIRKHIQSDAVNKTVNPEKQGRHNRNSSDYISGRSYLFDSVDVQELINKYYGTGEPKFTKSGKWKNKEIIVTEFAVGKIVNPDTGEEDITNTFTIHYSRTGTHIVPAPRKG